MLTLIGFAIIFLATTAGSALVYFFKHDIPKRTNAIILGFAAGVIGILFTVLACIPANAILRAATGIANLSAVLPWVGAVALILISMVLTFVAGLFPAGVAARKDPVIALRTE